MGNLREHEVHSAAVAQLGFVPGEVHYCALQSGVNYGFLRDNRRIPASRLHTTLVDAYDSVGRQNANNNVVMVSPDTHTQAAALTWDKNMTHIVGMYPEAFQNQRARINHTVTLASFLTVTGYGNLFKNLYFDYGSANATDLNLLTDTGGRNTYMNCHFLCENATPLDQATFDLVRLGSNEFYFKNCFFGQDTVPWTNGNMIEFQATADPPRAVFENCIFLMNADNAQVTFLKAVTALGRCLIIFKNCQFINMGTTLTLAIDGTGLSNARMYFDQLCSFHGVTDVVAAAKEAYVLSGAATYTAAATENLLGKAVDHTA